MGVIVRLPVTCYFIGGDRAADDCSMNGLITSADEPSLRETGVCSE